jgi:hypothetical protein
MNPARGVFVAMGMAIALFGSGAAWAEDAVGKWAGVVKAPEADIPFNLTVAKDGAGVLTATAESPTQAPGMVIPTENVASDGDKLSFEVAMAQGSYAGTWDAAKNAWVGVWKQSGYEMPMELKRAP